MGFKLLGGGSDLQTVVNDVNQNILELKNREVTEFFKDDTGTRRVLFGKGANGFYGLKVSPANVDVFTATDDQLIFNSAQNVFKIVATGTVVFPDTAANSVAGGQQEQSIEIETGVESDKALIAFVFSYNVESSSLQLPYIATTPSTGFGGLIAYRFDFTPFVYIPTGTIHIEVDSTNYLNFILGGSTMKWYVLQETAVTAS